jgi:hypothetical protein
MTVISLMQPRVTHSCDSLFRSATIFLRAFGSQIFERVDGWTPEDGVVNTPPKPDWPNDADRAARTAEVMFAEASGYAQYAVDHGLQGGELPTEPVSFGPKIRLSPKQVTGRASFSALSTTPSLRGLASCGYRVGGCVASCTVNDECAVCSTCRLDCTAEQYVEVIPSRRRSWPWHVPHCSAFSYPPVDAAWPRST